MAFDNTDQKVDAEVDGRKVDQSQNGSQHFPVPQGKRARLRAAIWDTWDKSPGESRLVQKGNTSNAYVSGMKEALDLKGNDLNYLTTYWNIGYIIGQIPSQLILTKIRPSIWLQALELLWSCLVMALAGTKNVKTIFALRFFIGLFEASAYPGIITLLGNCYTPQELAKRAAIFQASSSAGNMFSGYLQAALYPGMNGRAGLAAWQWLFIFDGPTQHTGNDSRMAPHIRRNRRRLFTSWVSETCGFSAEHRVVVIGVMEAIAFILNAWVPLLVYNTGEGPHFRIGYQMAAMLFAVELLMAGGIAVVEKRWPARRIAERQEDEREDGGGSV
ncbi:major facilitator superfamily domain-containing protein [Aspergillus venezuelensis]